LFGQTPASAAPTLIYAEVVLNGLPAGTFLLVRRDGGFLMRPDALRDLAIATPTGVVVRIDTEDFVSLSTLPGAVVRFDEARQELLLDVGAENFAATRLSPNASAVRASPGARALFVNYDLNIEADRQLVAGGIVETGISDNWGLAVNTVTVGRAATGSGVTRLDTFFVRDNPANLTRLVVGDTVTAPTNGLPPARFGGVRFGTAFDLRPDLVTFPTPGFRGQTTNPSQVELLVNGALAYQTDVARGPFAIEQVPLVTGAGQATVIVRDALGVERSVTSSYYASPELLRPGLSEWSVEAGASRRDYGVKSLSYGAPFVAGSYRTGLTGTMTVDGRVELSPNVHMASGGIALAWPAVGEFGIMGGISADSDGGSGTFYSVSFRRVSRSWSIAAAQRRATRNFVSLADDAAGAAAERLTEQLQVSASASMWRAGNFSLSYSALTYGDDRRAKLATANYGISVGPRGYLNAFAIRTASSGRPDDATVGVGFSLSLGNRVSASAQADNQGFRADVRQTPDYGGGFGYRLGISRATDDREQAAVLWRGQAVEAQVEAAQVNGRTAARLQVGGGLLLAGNSLVATRRIEDGLAVVDVDGNAGVRIYQDNRLVARTDPQGRAIVPNLRPYQQNRISLEAADLPLGTTMPHTTLLVVPRFRGAARADFQTVTATPVTLIVEQPDGKLLEPGAAVKVDGGEATFVGFGGEIFLNDSKPGLTIHAETAAGSCTVSLGDGLAFRALSKVGPLRCRLERESS
jgi:outer membrane usher protein